MNIFSHKMMFLLILGFSVVAFLSGNINSAHANQAGIKIMQKVELGRFLAAGNGMTLYSYNKDEKDVSNCIEGCAINWPPFYVNPVAVIEGCETSDFGTIVRDDGRKQTTYKSMPLYRFINDKYPNDTFGHELGGVWFIVQPYDQQESSKNPAK